MKNIFLAILLGAFFLGGCATTYTLDSLTPEEQAYLAKINYASSTFEMDKANAEEAWSRGNSFINRFSGMKIQSSNEYHVSTYNPNTSDIGTTGYEFVKELNGNKVKFRIRCLTKVMNVKYTEEVCRNNEKIMAHYMMTGELQEKFVDSKFSADHS